MFIEYGSWKCSTMKEMVSENMDAYILDEIKPCTTNLNDRAWWTVSTNGLFSVTTAYHVLRKKREKVD